MDFHAPFSVSNLWLLLIYITALKPQLTIDDYYFGFSYIVFTQFTQIPVMDLRIFMYRLSLLSSNFAVQQPDWMINACIHCILFGSSTLCAFTVPCKRDVTFERWHNGHTIFPLTSFPKHVGLWQTSAPTWHIKCNQIDIIDTQRTWIEIPNWCATWMYLIKIMLSN